MNKNKILIGAMDLAVIGILTFVFINLVTIPLVSPENMAYTNDRRPALSWGGMQGEYVLYLDDDPQFRTPLEAKVGGNSYAPGSDLDFGTYYWKVESGPFSSGTGMFTLGSSVVLSRDEETVRNEGNADLKLSGLGRMTGFFILGVNETLEIGRNENVVAEQR